MAKVNLLTIHWGMSYGAVMQTYATCRILENLGHEVTVINIMHPKVKHKYKNIKKWKYLIREIQFWKFKNKYFSTLTNKSYSINNINLPDADITVVGSDQVWNKKITGALAKSYYLDFVPYNQKKIALSSSFGLYTWDESAQYTKEVHDLLSRFNAISVRENTGVSILKEIFGLNAIQLLDPTLAYREFNDLLYKETKGQHIFSFLLNPGQSGLEMQKKIANDLSTKIYHPSLFDQIFKSGPHHWLTNIKNAKYVITDSFHGVAFSIIFQKQFFVFCANEKKFTRIHSLLELLGISDRYIKSYDDFLLRKNSLIKPINYKRIEEILNEEHFKYINFIKEHFI